MEPLLTEGQAWLNQAIQSRAEMRHSLIKSGELLAVQLRKRAIDLSCNRATESSPDIEALHFMAAKVAVLVFGAGSQASEPYERDVNYYRIFPSTAPKIAEYAEFKNFLSSKNSAQADHRRGGRLFLSIM